MTRIRSKQRIGIIGHFGGSQRFLDGQTVKTKILYKELIKSNQFDIICVDTYYNKVNRLKLLIDSLNCILRCREIIVLISGNGMKLYFPMLFWAKKIFGRKIYHDVIGGNLVEYIVKYPKWVKYLNSFIVNWVEFNKLKNKLESYGLANCEVIPNFKQLELIKTKNITEGEPYYFCTFSRVMKEKGISDAIQAMRLINNQAERILVILDIWGPVDDSYKEIFEGLLLENSEYVNYRGIVNYSESTKILSNYYALLFPTYWKGEGFPGTIIDAFASGLPVIATDWNANGDIIKNGDTGIIYPNNEQQTLIDCIMWAINHPDKICEMSSQCSEEAKKYLADKWIPKIIERLKV